MTYSDIYTKFLIEYDKQNITSSYPSLTVYEIATILDKAYLALIAQKLTGNNPRRAPFEIDIKAIEDLRPLIKSITLGLKSATNEDIDNCDICDLNDIPNGNFLYYVNAVLRTQYTSAINLPIGKVVQGLTMLDFDKFDIEDGYGVEEGGLISFYNKAGDVQYFAKLKIVQNDDIAYPMLIQYSNTNQPLNYAFYDNGGDIALTNEPLSWSMQQYYRLDSTKLDLVSAWKGRYYPAEERTKFTSDPVTLINHTNFNRFIRSSVNIPWIKTPMGCLEDNLLYILKDPFDHYEQEKKYGSIRITYIKRPQPFVLDDGSDAFRGYKVNEEDEETVLYEFELNDSMAEELINLAIVMALETIESPRIQTKEQTRALES